MSSQTTATPVTTSAGNKLLSSSGNNKKTVGTKVRPLSTQERMSMFMEHGVAGNKSTPRVIIRQDAKFKAACNKIRWLNKASEVATTKAMASVGKDKDSTTHAAGGSEKTDENSIQFYSFHEKADPSLDESVNPPIKLPAALLVIVMATLLLCIICVYIHFTDWSSVSGCIYTKCQITNG